VKISLFGVLQDTISINRTRRSAALAAFAVGLAALPAAGSTPVAASHVEALSSGETTDISARRKARQSWRERRVRHRAARHHRSQRRHLRHRGNRVAGIAPDLRALIAELQARHGPGSVRVISGRDGRAYRRSCHPFGQAFDAHVSRAVLADLRSRRFGLITYSGAMNHVHVSSCAREAGLRAHKRVGGRNIFARYAARSRPGG
jgi:hypothetical protein